MTPTNIPSSTEHNPSSTPKLTHTHIDAKPTDLRNILTPSIIIGDNLVQLVKQVFDPNTPDKKHGAVDKKGHQLGVLSAVYEELTGDAYFRNAFDQFRLFPFQHPFHLVTEKEKPILMKKFDKIMKTMLSCREELLLWFGSPQKALLCEQSTYFPPEYLPIVAKPWKAQFEKEVPDVKINARWQNPKSKTYLIDVVCKPQTQTSYVALANFFKPVNDRVVLDAKNQTITIKGVNAPSDEKPDQFANLSFPKKQ